MLLNYNENTRTFWQNLTAFHSSSSDIITLRFLSQEKNESFTIGE